MWLVKPMTRRPVARSTAAVKVGPIAFWYSVRILPTASSLALADQELLVGEQLQPVE